MKKKKSVFRRIEIFFRATRRLLNIRSSSDPQGTVKSISDNIALKGYNIWILVCSALLASIGLDTNSTAVIIGAMLISPLMSPILGVGLGLGVNDWAMFTKSLRNLGIATFASLLASLVYFISSPLGEPTQEIMSRTYPTLFDVGIALFGGIAGIVSGSRQEKTNAIPGVAIATALMPPLCAAGYGLANLRMNIFFGAFYLFIINAVFISISTYLIVKYLKFPLHEEPDEKTRNTVRQAMLISLLLVTAPSVYFLFSLINRVQTIREIDSLIAEVSDTLVQDSKHEILNVEKPVTANEVNKVKKIKMYVSGESVDSTIRNYYAERFREIGDYEFTISILNNVSPEEIQRLTYNVTRENVLELKTKFERLESEFDTIQVNQDREQKARIQELLHQDILAELKIFFPDLDTVKVIDYRKFREEFNQPNATARGDSSNRTYNITRLMFKEQEQFPYVELACEIRLVSLDSMLLDSLRREFVKDWRWVARQDFPYFRLARLSKEENLPKATLSSTTLTSQMPSQPSNTEQNPGSSLPERTLDVEVILYWKRNLGERELEIEDRQRIREFLRLKLTKEPDSLNIKHFGPLFVEEKA